MREMCIKKLINMKNSLNYRRTKRKVIKLQNNVARFSAEHT